MKDVLRWQGERINWFSDKSVKHYLISEKIGQAIVDIPHNRLSIRGISEEWVKILLKSDYQNELKLLLSLAHKGCGLEKILEDFCKYLFYSLLIGQSLHNFFLLKTHGATSIIPIFNLNTLLDRKSVV